jgi:hypothetical protein
VWRSLAAQAICNRQVGGSNPSTGTKEESWSHFVEFHPY